MQQDLPEKRAELYKQCVDTLLFRWDTSRDIRRRREFKPEHKRLLLAEIAWHCHRQGRRYYPGDELLAIISDFLPTVRLAREQNRLILREIEEENGLLKEQAHGWHGFLHLTMQEYFVAQYVSENDKLEELLKYRGDPWWEEVLSLYAGYTADASSLLQELLAQEKRQFFWKDVFHTHLLWAGSCGPARPGVKQTSLREEIIARLFELLKKTPYSLTEEQVTRTLAEIGGNEVQARLLAMLRDKQDASDVRGSVADALGQLGERAVVPELLRFVATSSYFNRDSADALQEVARDRTTIRAFARLLRKSAIADGVHRTLWTISQREKVRVSMLDWKVIKLFRVSRW